MPHHQRKAIPIEALDPELTDVSRQVIGASIEVHKALGPGYAREVYRNALTTELDALGIPYDVDHRVPVKYKDRSIGDTTIGLYINNRFAVEPIAEPREIDGVDRTKLRAKLRAADLELGLLINFAERRLKDGLVRVLNPDKLKLDPNDSSVGRESRPSWEGDDPDHHDHPHDHDSE